MVIRFCGRYYGVVDLILRIYGVIFDLYVLIISWYFEGFCNFWVWMVFGFVGFGCLLENDYNVVGYWRLVFLIISFFGGVIEDNVCLEIV